MRRCRSMCTPATLESAQGARRGPFSGLVSPSKLHGVASEGPESTARTTTRFSRFPRRPDPPLRARLHRTLSLLIIFSRGRLRTSLDLSAGCRHMTHSATRRSEETWQFRQHAWPSAHALVGSIIISRHTGQVYSSFIASSRRSDTIVAACLRLRSLLSAESAVSVQQVTPPWGASEWETTFSLGPCKPSRTHSGKSCTCMKVRLSNSRSFWLTSQKLEKGRREPNAYRSGVCARFHPECFSAVCLVACPVEGVASLGGHVKTWTTQASTRLSACPRTLRVTKSRRRIGRQPSSTIQIKVAMRQRY